MAIDPITATIDLIKTGLNKFVRDKVDEGTMKQLELDFEKHLLSEATKQDGIFREFVIKYEGAAEEYKNIPIVGPLLLILRGAIRPVFTLAVAYWNWVFFTTVTGWETEKIQILGTINAIVLIFWFGERAVTNSGILNIITKVFEKGK
jgi:hypothetical protein